MKILKTALGKTTIKISKKEWIFMGKRAGWISNKLDALNKQVGPIEPIEPIEPAEPISKTSEKIEDALTIDELRDYFDVGNEDVYPAYWSILENYKPEEVAQAIHALDPNISLITVEDVESALLKFDYQQNKKIRDWLKKNIEIY